MLLLGAVSMALTVINIFCIFLTAIAVLKVATKPLFIYNYTYVYVCECVCYVYVF